MGKRADMRRSLLAGLLVALFACFGLPAQAQQARVVASCGSLAPFGAQAAGGVAFPTIDTTGRLCLSGGGGGGSIVGGTTPITGTCPAGQFLYNNSGVVGCSASSATIALPQAVTGGVSGGVPYFSATTTMSASALLVNNALMLGGGAAAAPKTTTTGAGVVTAVGIAPNAVGGMALVSTVPTAGNFVKWAAGGLVDGGAGGTTIIFPQSVTNGVSGGVPYFSAAGTMSAGSLLTTNALLLGGGAGAGPSPLASLGTTTTVLHGNAAGAPTFGAVAIGTDVSGLGTGVATALAANLNASTGVASAAAPLTAGGSGSVTGAFGYYVCTGVCTVTLPTPAAGFQFCVRNDDNIATVITIAAISGCSSKRRLSMAMGR